MHKPAPGIDMTVVRDRKRAMVRGLVEVHGKRFAVNHVEFISGDGTFVSPRTISVKLKDGGTRLLTADLVVVSTGSRAAIYEGFTGQLCGRMLAFCKRTQSGAIPNFASRFDAKLEIGEILWVREVVGSDLKWIGSFGSCQTD